MHNSFTQQMQIQNANANSFRHPHHHHFIPASSSELVSSLSSSSFLPHIVDFSFVFVLMEM